MMLKIFLPLVATIVIELLVLLYLGERRKRVLWASVAMNIATNVPLNFVALLLGSSLTTVIVGELVVIVVEALCYEWVLRRWSQAWMYSLLCNAVSFLTGCLMYWTYLFFLNV